MNNIIKWVCLDCGSKYGKRACGVATWHDDKCDICRENKPVTEPRDFGGLIKEISGTEIHCSNDIDLDSLFEQPKKKKKRTRKNYYRMYQVEKEMRTHYEELFQSAVGELRFKNLLVDILYNTLDEIESMTTDELAKKVCTISKERKNLDVLIHSRNIFRDDENKLDSDQ